MGCVKKKLNNVPTTFDEFVETQGTPVFHRTIPKNYQSIEESGLQKIDDSNIFLADTEEGVIKLTKNLDKFKSTKDSKMYEVYISPEAKILKESDPEFAKLINSTTPFDRTEKLSELGYDGMKILDETEIWNPEVLKTRSQLENIWKQTNGSSAKEVPGVLGLGGLLGTKTLTSEDENATYETKIPGMWRTLKGDKMTYERKEKPIPVLGPEQEPAFTPTAVTDKLVQGIAYNETRGKEAPYTFQQPSGDEKMGDAIGKYQITEAELASYGEKFLGFKVKPGVFLNEPRLQDAYIRNKVAFLESEGLDIPEILALHRAGMSGWGDPVKVRNKVIDRAEYIKSALDYMSTL